MELSKESKEKIGIMGGTFDPIHFGHLVTAEEARVKFGMDEIIFIPAGIPPHKNGETVTEPEYRCRMTSLAVSDNDYFSVSQLEAEKESKSYTIETVEYFLKEYGPELDLFFITGADAVLEIDTWKKPGALLKKCTVIAATRPGYHLNLLDSVIDKVAFELRNKVICMEVPGMAISSTMIRMRVSEGKSIKYLLPEKVENYIYENNLYIDS